MAKKSALNVGKKKTPFFKKWWVWLIIVLAFIGALMPKDADETETDDTSALDAAIVSESKTDDEPEADQIIESTPEPTPITTPKPTPEAATTPTPETSPEPDSTPEPTPDNTPMPTPEPTPEPTPQVDQPAGGGYIGNSNSLKFHEPNCDPLPAEHNRVYFDTRQQAIDAGYAPCKKCNP